MDSEVFPEPILSLPEADVPIEGAKAYLSQSEGHQIIFMAFDADVEVPVHSHQSQWGVVIEGKIELEIEGTKKIYSKGDHYFIPRGVKHSARIFAGYVDVTFFDQADRYKPK